jgi:hypothetical protein
MQPRLDRPDRDSKPIGDLGEAQLVAMVEQQDRTLVDGQALEGAIERIRVGRRVAELGVTLGHWPIGGLHAFSRDFANAAPPSQALPAGVDRDPAEPGVEAIGIAQTRKLPPGEEERLLGRVLCIGLVAEDGEGRSKHDIDLSANEGIESRSVAMASALNELSLQAPSSRDVPLPDSMRSWVLRFAPILETPDEPHMPRDWGASLRNPSRPAQSAVCAIMRG